MTKSRLPNNVLYIARGSDELLSENTERLLNALVALVGGDYDTALALLSEAFKVQVQAEKIIRLLCEGNIDAASDLVRQMEGQKLKKLAKGE